MSVNDHRGAAYAVRQLMRQAQDEIDAGTRAGVTVKWKTANPAKVTIGWMKRRLLRGEFRKRA